MKTRLEKTAKNHHFLRIALMGGVFCVLIGALGLSIAIAWMSRDLPNPDNLITREIAQTTKIYDRTGTILLTEFHGEENRTLIQIKDLPSYVPHATVAIEDKNFYNHRGVSWRGLARAFLSSITNKGRVQGTSTLTQQLVKNAILTNERTAGRKIREIVLSLQLERTFSKDQILQLYLNEIPYGSTVYGIESAAQNFFGKTAKDLTLDEAALLAALPQSPSRYSPYGSSLHGDNRELLKGRQHYVLDQMAEQGYVTREQADTAKTVETLTKIIPRSQNIGKAPHFTQYVKDLLEETYGTANVSRKGYHVLTTLDVSLQEIAEEEVKKGVEERGKTYKFSNAALLSMDPKTGQVLAMVGSKDFSDKENQGEFNVTLSPRQPGSSFKPIVYAAAFEKGYTPDMTLWDVNTIFKSDVGDFEPKNYDFKEHGPISARSALQGSLNIAAVKILYLVGVGRVLDIAESLGYSTLRERSRFGLSLVLGAGEVKLIEHAAAYSAFANGGLAVKPSAILRVEDSAGAILEEWKPNPEPIRVFSEETAARITDVLSDNQSRSYVFGLRSALTLPSRPVAAKSGTTNNFRDAWTVGYTPSLVTGVWVGNNNNAEMARGADGSKLAGPIWQNVMKRALEGKPVEKFPTVPANPEGLSRYLSGKSFESKNTIDILTGLPATEATAPEFQAEIVSREAHSELWYVDKDNPREVAPKKPQDDPQFTSWESSVQDWVTRTNWLHPTSTATTTYAGAPTNPEELPKIALYEPTPNTIWTTSENLIRAEVQSKYAIKSVQVIHNGRLIGSRATAPWDITTKLPATIENGAQTLTVVATNEKGQKGITSVTIALNRSATSLQTSILSLTEGALVRADSLPIPVAIQLADQSQVKKVDLYLQSSDGSTRLLGSELAPNQSTITINWKISPGNGAYFLFPVLTDMEGAAHAAPGINIIVTD